jgi:hypothetical protein
MIKKVFLFVLILACVGSISAQNDFMGSATRRNGTFFIPVVVHIVFNNKNSEENISEENILSQIEVLNQDFRQKNDQSGLPIAFKNIAADVNIEFFLATTDPKGKKTNGIRRVGTSSKSVWEEKAMLNGSQKRKVYFSNIEGDDAWDTKKYLNIWVCKMPSDKSGYATFPNNVKTDEADGIVIDYCFFGTKGVAAANKPFHLGRTCTHEIGHFLNLQHLWGASVSNDDCMTDDGVDDTPRQTNPVAGCPSNPIFQCGNSVMYQNFMNYTNDDCMSLFTLGQKARMTDALMFFRKDLISNMIATNDTQVADFQVFPNPASNFLNIKMEQKGDYFLANAQGQALAHGTFEAGINQLEISNFPNGIYQIGIIIDYVRINKIINILH